MISTPAEPIFLLGVALGLVVAGTIFILNLRRWQARQRLR
jgi:hypothetical protein